MALATGTRFGPYEVVEQIGSGGMGEVWRARDTSLKRDVAVKALPESFATDADRLSRFRREAEILAALNHPNIATIHGLENAGDRTVIVMELVDGPTLADRIAEGPIAPAEALGIARQVADALEAAHGRQIVHRDLKPANIKLKDDGSVKVLDFGISKPIDAQAISGGSPVMTTPAVTQTGVILGTAAYMSPEQARGKLVDQRTDIWAFGCLLFEMLTGQPAFAGEDVMATLARVIDRDTDLSSMPGTISPAVRHAIKLCLQKDVRKRLADIRDVRLALDGELESELPRAAVASRTVWPRALPAAAVGALAAGAAAYFALGEGEPAAPPPEVTRLIYAVPDGQNMANLNIPAMGLSPDGRQLIYAANGALYLRRLNELEARQVPGTEGEIAIVPGFSPDGQWIVYGSITDGQLKRIAVEGGTPLPIMAEWPAGGWRWELDDFIFYGAAEVIGRVPAAGGTHEVLLEEPGYLHFEPRLLPGGESLIVERRPQSAPDRTEIAVWSLSTGETTVLFPGKQGQFLAPGYLVYFEPTLGLMARTFDPATLDYGSPIALVEGIMMVASTGGVQFRLSPDGDLVYIRGQAAAGGGTILALATESGSIEALDVASGLYSFPSISPAGDQLAVQVAGGDDANIFVYDLSGQSEIRQLTFEGGNQHPAWTPDGQWISYSSNRDGQWRIYRQRADGSGVAEPLTEPAGSESHQMPAWAPDGERLAYVVQDQDGGAIWIVSVADGSPELLVGGDGDQFGIAFSPEGDAIAYVSNASGTFEVLAEPFPPDGSRRRISEQSIGSIWPVWSRDGTRLSYQLQNGSFAAVDLNMPGFGIRNRRSLPFNGLPLQRRLDSMPNSDQMLVTVPQNLGDIGGPRSPEIVVVENWVEELKQRLPIE